MITCQCPGCGLIGYAAPDINFNLICKNCGSQVRPLPSKLVTVEEYARGEKARLLTLLGKEDCPQIIWEWIDNLPPERLTEVVTQVFRAAVRV
jgi:hypothetical protein